MYWRRPSYWISDPEFHITTAELKIVADGIAAPGEQAVGAVRQIEGDARRRRVERFVLPGHFDKRHLGFLACRPESVMAVVKEHDARRVLFNGADMPPGVSSPNSDRSRLRRHDGQILREIAELNVDAHRPLRFENLTCAVRQIPEHDPVVVSYGGRILAIRADANRADAADARAEV